MNEVRFLVDVSAGKSGGRGNFTTPLLGADIPALLLTGVLGSSGGQLDFSPNILTSGTVGVEVPSRVKGMGHYVLVGASFEDKARSVRG